MEKIEWWLKLFLGAIGTVFSALVDGMGVVFAVLLVFLLADYVTGLAAAIVEKSFSVENGVKGFIKKIYIIILIGLITLLERTVFQTNHLADGVSFAYLAIEFMSIIENGHRLGVPVPQQVMNVFEKLKSRDDKNNSS